MSDNQTLVAARCKALNRFVTELANEIVILEAPFSGPTFPPASENSLRDHARLKLRKRMSGSTANRPGLWDPDGQGRWLVPEQLVERFESGLGDIAVLLRGSIHRSVRDDTPGHDGREFRKTWLNLGGRLPLPDDRYSADTDLTDLIEREQAKLEATFDDPAFDWEPAAERPGPGFLKPGIGRTLQGPSLRHDD